MSDRPLFQDADEQEERYASDRVPGSGPGDAAADTDLVPGALVPDIGAATPTSGNVFAPTAGGAGLDDMVDDEDTAHDRDGPKE